MPTLEVKDSEWIVRSAIASILAAMASGLAAAASAAVAIFTYRLAKATVALASDTHDLALQTTEASSRADVHHQEALAPIVTIVQPLDNQGYSDRLLLSNGGTGAAVDVRLTLTFRAQDLRRHILPFSLRLAVGSIAPGAATPFQWFDKAGGSWRLKTFEGLEGLIEYEDAFGNLYATKYSLSTGLAATWNRPEISLRDSASKNSADRTIPSRGLDGVLQLIGQP